MGLGSTALRVGAGIMLVAGAATQALADVKAGVDAWSAGDYAEAVRQWSGPARNGDADAQFNLAQAYRLGRGIDPDPAQAETLYAAAAAQGHLRAGDNYGLMLFQRGERERALPFVLAAAERGDPRAQYLVGVAHFNGDLVDKDWERAYALLTLANATGLPQARGAIAQMDEYIPIEQREAAQTLAQVIKREAESVRARQVASAELNQGVAVVARSDAPIASSVDAGDEPSSLLDDVRTAVAASGTADVPPVVAAAGNAPVPATAAEERDTWKVQLGTFRLAGGPDRMWEKLSGDPALTGAVKATESSGPFTKLLATGFATRADAAKACAALKRSGTDCLVTR